MGYDYDLDDLIRHALEEDIGAGDITTLATVDADRQAKARLIAKEAGVICGLSVFRRVFQLLDDSVQLHCLAREGESVEQGCLVAQLTGSAQAILSGERVALNLIQRLSGIATRTRAAAAELKGTGSVVVDTRKTTPGLRKLEKYAVRTGGGSNHRFNLADGVLIKDNHIAAAGGIRQAVERARKLAPHTLKIEVETENFDQINEALQSGADIIMLDNMSLTDMKKAVELIGGRALTEASGNMGDKNLRAVAETGVDLISIGALTHSVRAMDLSLRFDSADI